MKRLFLMITGICFFIIYSCQKEVPLNEGFKVNSNIELRDLSTLSDKDKKRVDFAKVFATALSDSDLRVYMKQQYTALDIEDDEFLSIVCIIMMW